MEGVCLRLCIEYLVETSACIAEKQHIPIQKWRGERRVLDYLVKPTDGPQVRHGFAYLYDGAPRKEIDVPLHPKPFPVAGNGHGDRSPVMSYRCTPWEPARITVFG